MSDLAVSVKPRVQVAMVPTRRRSSAWTWIGLALVLAFTALEAVDRDSPAMRTLTITFISIVLEAFPFIMVGAVVGGVIEVFVSREWVARILPRQPILACMAAGCLGLALPVCECAVVPVARRLVRKGVPFSAAMTYLLAGPIFNPLVAISTCVAYGWNWRVVGVRMACGYGIGVTVGYIMGRLFKGHEALVPDDAISDGHHASPCGHDHAHDHENAYAVGGPGSAATASASSLVYQFQPAGPAGIGLGTTASLGLAVDDACGCGHDHGGSGHTAHGPGAPFGRRLLAVLDHAGEDFLYVGQFLIVGALVASASRTFIPDNFFLEHAGAGVASILVMMVLAVLLNLCSEADAFVAASFRSILPPSAQMAFMVLGPMLDFKLTAMYLGFLRKRAFVTMVAIMGTLVFLSMLFLHFSGWEGIR